MPKTVLIDLANNIVDNVIILAPGTPFDPPSGIMMLTVPNDTIVAPGMLYIMGSSPPEFVAAPDDPDTPALTAPEAMAEYLSKKAAADAALDEFNRIAGVG